MRMYFRLSDGTIVSSPVRREGPCGARNYFPALLRAWVISRLLRARIASWSSNKSLLFPAMKEMKI